MENSTQALMLAFAVLIFVIALAVSFNTFAKAKQTADIVLKYSDRETFQTLKNYKASDYEEGRTVNLDTVIATVARCSREKFSVKVIDLNNSIYNFEYDTTTKESINQQVAEFINEFSDGSKGRKFKETYVEVSTSGKTYFADDGTTLEENVGKKLYITYKAYNEED